MRKLDTSPLAGVHNANGRTMLPKRSSLHSSAKSESVRTQRPEHEARYSMLDQLNHEIDLGIYDEVNSARLTQSTGSTAIDSRCDHWGDIIRHVNMLGVDQITALSQAAVNSHFKTSWSGSVVAFDYANPGPSLRMMPRLSRWAHSNILQCSLKSPTVHLHTDRRVTIVIRLVNGVLKNSVHAQTGILSESDGHNSHFSDWNIAFETSLKMCEHESLPGVRSEWHTRFRRSAVFLGHGQNSELRLMHIYIDFENVTFLPSLSHIHGRRISRHDLHSNRTAQIVIPLLREHYLGDLSSAGHHILFTVPVWKTAASAPTHGLTSVSFHTCANSSTDPLTGRNSIPSSEAVIVILGMSGGRPLPSPNLNDSTYWVARSHQALAYGTVCISRDVFLRDQLLPLLVDFNAATTVIPSTFGISRDRWQLDLTNWARHPKRKAGDCPFSPQVASDDDIECLRYQWRHQVRHVYDYQGGVYLPDATYYVITGTDNHLSVPTTFQHGALQIELHGRVILEIGAKVQHNTWRARCSAYWRTSLTIYFESNGLRTRLVNSPTQFTEVDSLSEMSHGLSPNTGVVLRKALQQSMDLDGTMGEHRTSENIWQSCYPGLSSYNLVHPAFNRDGHLLFQLRPQSTSGTGHLDIKPIKLSMPSSTPLDTLHTRTKTLISNLAQERRVRAEAMQAPSPADENQKKRTKSSQPSSGNPAHEAMPPGLRNQSSETHKSPTPNSNFTAQQGAQGKESRSGGSSGPRTVLEPVFPRAESRASRPSTLVPSGTNVARSQDAVSEQVARTACYAKPVDKETARTYATASTQTEGTLVAVEEAHPGKAVHSGVSTSAIATGVVSTQNTMQARHPIAETSKDLSLKAQQSGSRDDVTRTGDAQLSRTAFAINQVQESAGGTIMRKGWSGGLTESPKELSPDRELVAQAAEVQQQGSRAQTRGSLSQVALSKSAASTEHSDHDNMMTAGEDWVPDRIPQRWDSLDFSGSMSEGRLGSPLTPQRRFMGSGSLQFKLRGSLSTIEERQSE